MSRRKRISIPAPIAYVLDVVCVLNYRMKPAQWEQGRVTGVKYRPAERWEREGRSGFHAEHWSYDVFIEREATEDRWGRARGGGYIVSCGDDGIKAV